MAVQNAKNPDPTVQPASNSGARIDFDLKHWIEDAETKIRHGLETVNRWTDQMRDLAQTEPGALLASLAAGGFMTGLMLRKGRAQRNELNKDPLIVFLTAAVAGIAVGPDIVNEILGVSNPRAMGTGTGIIDIKPSSDK